jgi:hypothetical protein
MVKNMFVFPLNDERALSLLATGANFTMHGGAPG